MQRVKCTLRTPAHRSVGAGRSSADGRLEHVLDGARPLHLSLDLGHLARRCIGDGRVCVRARTRVCARVCARARARGLLYQCQYTLVLHAQLALLLDALGHQQ
jgi:hypothetical protein